MKKLTTFLGGIAVLAIAPLANANLALTYKVDGAATVTCANVGGSPNASAVCFSATPTSVGGGIVLNTFSGTGDQNVQPTEEFSSVLRIQNTNLAGTDAVNLTLWISDQDFTVPTAPPNIIWSSNLQLTSTTGSGTVGMTSCANPANALEVGGTFCVGGQTLANTGLAYSGISTVPTDTVSRAITVLPPGYALSEVITLSLGAGSSLNVIASQALTAVPEPMSITLLGGALLVVAGVVRRKRNQRA